MPVAQSRLASRLVSLLARRRLTIALAEATTGGLAAHLITQVPGASAVLSAGIAPYSNQAKVKLGVPHETIRDFGAVSRETAEGLAVAVRQWAASDVGLAETGIAGPANPNAARLAGTFWIALATASAVTSRQYTFEANRMGNQQRAAQAALSLALELLESR